MGRPVTCASNRARMASTSGSSGMSSPDFRLDRSQTGRGARLGHRPRLRQGARRRGIMASAGLAASLIPPRLYPAATYRCDGRGLLGRKRCRAKPSRNRGKKKGHGGRGRCETADRRASRRDQPFSRAGLLRAYRSVADILPDQRRPATFDYWITLDEWPMPATCRSSDRPSIPRSECRSNPCVY